MCTAEIASTQRYQFYSSVKLFSYAKRIHLLLTFGGSPFSTLSSETATRPREGYAISSGRCAAHENRCIRVCETLAAIYYFTFHAYIHAEESGETCFFLRYIALFSFLKEAQGCNVVKCVAAICETETRCWHILYFGYAKDSCVDLEKALFRDINFFLSFVQMMRVLIFMSEDEDRTKLLLIDVTDFGRIIYTDRYR